MNNKVNLSIIIPVFNEQGNIKPLYKNLMPVANQLKAEVIFVNDGSTDETEIELKSLKKITVINLRKKFGQTAALLAGVQNSIGKIVVTMDGDGQNDPTDITKLVKKLDQGYDVVIGWRKNRHDDPMKKFLSKGARILRLVVLKDKSHDSGCTLKAYRRECFGDLDLFGEMHRFIPALLSWKGYKIAEIQVRHHPRKIGQSKYNFTRVIKGIIDIINVWFWYRYSARPLHLFGGAGIAFFLIGMLIIFWMVSLKLIYGMPLSTKIWPLVGFFFMLTGVQLFVSGILADIAIKSYYISSFRTTYSIKNIQRL